MAELLLCMLLFASHSAAELKRPNASHSHKFRIDIARAGEIVSEAAPVSSQAASIGFAAGLGALCYGLKPSLMDNLNSALVIGVVLTFLVSLAFRSSKTHSLPSSCIKLVSWSYKCRVCWGQLCRA